jgi:hypothetical protein
MKNLLKLSLLTLTLFSLACNTSVEFIPEEISVIIPVNDEPRDVYVAGIKKTNIVGNQNPMLWNKRIETILTSNNTSETGATSVFVSGTDVYVAGHDRNYYIARYWKNGIPVDLTDSQNGGQANSIVIDGTNVWLAGNYKPLTFGNKFASYWRNNGVPSALSSVGFEAEVKAIKISTSGVPSCVGYEKTSSGLKVAKYWSGTATTLGWLNGSVANGIALSGSNVYIVGTDNIANGSTRPKTWFNGSVGTLYNSSGISSASGIALSGSDIYISGNDGNKAVYWKNGTQVILGDGAANGISVIGTDVYVVGNYISTSNKARACYWRNGTKVELTNTNSIDDTY